MVLARSVSTRQHSVSSAPWLLSPAASRGQFATAAGRLTGFMAVRMGVCVPTLSCFVSTAGCCGPCAGRIFPWHHTCCMIGWFDVKRFDKDGGACPYCRGGSVPWLLCSLCFMSVVRCTVAHRRAGGGEATSFDMGTARSSSSSAVGVYIFPLLMPSAPGPQPAPGHFVALCWREKRRLGKGLAAASTRQLPLQALLLGTR